MNETGNKVMPTQATKVVPCLLVTKIPAGCAVATEFFFNNPDLMLRKQTELRRVRSPSAPIDFSKLWETGTPMVMAPL